MKTILTICIMFCLLALPVMAAVDPTTGKIDSLTDLTSGALDAWNDLLSDSTRLLLIKALGLVIVCTIIIVAVGILGNISKSSVGKKTGDSKLSTEGIYGNAGIIATAFIGIIALGIVVTLISGL